MLLKKALSVMLPCLIVMAGVMATSGYVYADKRYDKEYGREKSSTKSKHRSASGTYSKHDRDAARPGSKHDRPNYNAQQRPDRPSGQQGGSRPRPDNYQPYRPSTQHYGQPRPENYRPYRPSTQHTDRPRPEGYQPNRPPIQSDGRPRPENYRPYRPSTQHYDRPYRPSMQHYGTRPRPEYHYHKGKKYRRVIVIPSYRHHDHYIYTRPFRYAYPYYRPLYVDDQFWGWLAFTLITLQILDNLNDDQRHAHEHALYRATRAPLGETIYWSDTPDIVGSVTPVWEGSSNTGQYCREYRHEVSIGDRTEVAYGTACRRADGSWEIVQ